MIKEILTASLIASLSLSMLSYADDPYANYTDDERLAAMAHVEIATISQCYQKTTSYASFSKPGQEVQFFESLRDLIQKKWGIDPNLPNTHGGESEAARGYMEKYGWTYITSKTFNEPGGVCIDYGFYRPYDPSHFKRLK